MKASPRQKALRCLDCAGEYSIVDGIPHLVCPERQKAIAQFCEKYDALRLQEGWASEMPEFYLHLPFQDLSGRHPREWRLRAKSFQFLQKWLQNSLGKRPLRILEVGAGSGWMSRHLAEHHDVLALDVNAGPHGLAALPAAQRHFLAIQAELEHLPLASRCLDVIIAGASLHYTSNWQAFFKGAARVLRPGGKLIVADSPVYPDRQAAAAAHERTREYYAQMGVPELAGNYSGLVASVFVEQENFHFLCRRRDLNRVEDLKKRLREKLGKPVGARFPMWIGERLPEPDELVRHRRPRAGALIIQENKLLTFFHHRDGAPARWRIPGGRIESGETPEQAARRELMEEIGIDIAIERLFGRYLTREKSEWYFLAKVNSEDLPAADSAQEGPSTLQWLPLARLAECDLRPPGLKWELVEYFNA